MASLNKVMIVGNVGKDPNINHLQNGDAVCNFSVATSESWKDKTTGEKKEKTEWHRCVAFRRLAEICGEYLHKGKQVYIEGRLQTREWEDKDGNRRWTTEIMANQMLMLGPKDDFSNAKESDFAHPSSHGEVVERMYEKPPEPVGDLDDDIPF